MLTARREGVEEPCIAYDSMVELWKRSRAVIRGERYVKALDTRPSSDNLLLPFSPSMTQAQYNFYKAEAELPGIVSQFARMLVGGLLRKQPQITYSSKVPEDAQKWISSSIAMDGGSLVAFMDEALFEEVQTSRAWVFVEYPSISKAKSANFTKKDWDQIKPYPLVWRAESIINWQTEIYNGVHQLSRIILRGVVQKTLPGEFHPVNIDTAWVHEVENGVYQVRTFEFETNIDPKVISGMTQVNKDAPGFKLMNTVQPKMHGEVMTFIPAWPLNGSIEAVEPAISPLVDKEIALYNKMSRRNHLLYGAATFTPWIASSMQEEEFNKVVSGGLGSWIQLHQEDKIGVVATPTDALKDCDRAIEAAITEMARMGIRMLTPESAQSGVALEIRNAAQTAQLGTLNLKISSAMADVISHLINRRYNLQLTREDVEFSLSSDFSPVPLGDAWLRLATEWYEKGFIPRSSWLTLIKANDLIEPDYDDDAGQLEINADELVMPDEQEMDQGVSRKPTKKTPSE